MVSAHVTSRGLAQSLWGFKAFRASALPATMGHQSSDLFDALVGEREETIKWGK